ncbi:DUF3267 domain-containing protein [Ktedonospora formicarum]|uniref:DUF3267 domain-containing protein n=1 Tax=Ktedonospora formicarum TaxID=2778364 RepID=A0A8J3I307_9CHLR|nr:DUF3267 domain-containing protein [Ktedonospora formicarum]GHO45093.1 hypothetical protein KSX_32560 [Ktedonospora formicarum]
MGAPMILEVIDRYRPQRRAALQREVDQGKARTIDEVELLGEEELRPLARLSARMLLISGLTFALCNIASYALWAGQYGHSFAWWQGLTFWSVLLWLVLNIISYILILPLHEAIHGLAILFWGGRPYFGAKLPLALYCGARAQLFSRGQYAVIALAPLVVITLLGLILIAWQPGLAAYIQLALSGNFAGAAGDVLVYSRQSKLPQDVLLEDSETGYRAWQIASENEQ